MHYVGALGDAEANCRYYASKPVGASAHYYVGFRGDVYQSVLDKDIAWHCGTKNGYKHPECRNDNSISIEMCVKLRPGGSQDSASKDWYFEAATVETSIKLARQLIDTYNIQPDNVIRHYDVTGKICPNPYVFNHTRYTWTDFKRALVTANPISGWIQYPEGWRYHLGSAAHYVRNDWYQTPDNNWYWFDANGIMVTNAWYFYKDKWYYLGANGAMVEGIQKMDNKWYFFNKDGTLATTPVVLTPGDDGALKYPGVAV